MLCDMFTATAMFTAGVVSLLLYPFLWVLTDLP